MKETNSQKERQQDKYNNNKKKINKISTTHGEVEEAKKIKIKNKKK